MRCNGREPPECDGDMWSMAYSHQRAIGLINLQYLGVPVYLVSMNGLICGSLSMMLIPVMGSMVDGGPNPKRKRMLCLLLGLVMFVSGYLTIALASYLKANPTDTVVPGSNLSEISYPSSRYTTPFNVRIYDTTFHSKQTVHSITQTNSNGLAVTAILGIIGFTFLDIGYDTSMSQVKTFLIDNVPEQEQARILFTSALVASYAGVLNSLISSFDISSFVGPLLGMDSVATTLFVLCLFSTSITILAYMASFSVGFWLSRKNLKPTNIAKDDEKQRLISSQKYPKHSQSTPNSNLNQTLNLKPTSCQIDQSLMKSIEPQNKTYGTCQNETNSLVNSLPSMPVSDSFERSCTNEPTDSIDEETEPMAKCMTSRQTKAENRKNDESTSNKIENSKYSVSIEGRCKDKRGHEQPKHMDKGNSQKEEKKATGRTYLSQWAFVLEKRLAMVFMAAFGAFGCLSIMTIYISNTLTKEIVKGDPLALPGTEGYYRYQEGLRTASIGLFISYVTNVFSSLISNKLLSLMGAIPLFMVFNITLGGSAVLFCVMQRVSTYYVLIAMYGPFRCATFSLPFLLATKFSQAKNSSEANMDAKEDNLGKVISLLGFLFTLHYFLISCIMGPLMDATGSSWPPAYYLIGCIVFTMIPMSVLLFP